LDMFTNLGYMIKASRMALGATLAMLTVALIGLMWASPAWAGTITVSTNADEENDDNGRCSLREAIFNANGNESLSTGDCAGGTGEDTITFDVDSFDTPGSPATITLGSQLPIITDPAGLSIEGRTLDGEEVDITISGDNSVRVFEVANGAKLDLKNLTVADGVADGLAPLGAGLLNDRGTVTVSDSTFSGNNATDPLGPAGGGIFNDDGTLTVTDSTFSGNSVTGQGTPRGGGIFNSDNGTLTVTDSTLSENSATDPTGNTNATGGGIDNAGTLSVTSSTFSGNFTLSEDSTAVPPNPNETYGGGIHSSDGAQSSDFTVTVVNSTFSENSASDGGGIFSDDKAKLTNSTFSKNSATRSGGAAITAGPDQSSEIIVGNTIVANTTPGRNCFGLIVDGGYNIDDGTTCEFHASTSKSTDPKLDPGGLDDNGGPTQTIELQPTSPAIDQGDASGSDTDQRGEPRPHDFADIPNAPGIVTGSESDGSDIGAFEVQELTNRPPVANNDVYSTNEDAALNVAAPGVLSNDTDADGTPLSATLVSSPTHGSATLNADGSFTYTPAANYEGPDAFTYKASDGTAESPEARVEITVNAVNDAPTISDIADQRTNEDTATQDISFTIGDVETSAANLTLEGSSSDTTLVPNANVTFEGSGTDRTLKVTPAANQFGEATITVSVSDGEESTSDTFELVVISLNDAPSFTKGADQTKDEDAGAQSVLNWATNISAGPNESGQTVSFEVTNNTNPALFSTQPSVASNGTLTYTPAPDAFGMATVSVKITDNGGTDNGGVNESVVETFTITVNAVNDAPTVALSSGAQCLSDTSASGKLEFTVTDVDSPLNSLNLSGSSSNTTLIRNSNLINGGNGTNSANRTLTLSAVPKKSGTAIVTVRVSDATDSSTLLITVKVGTPNTETITGTNGADVIFGLGGQGTLSGAGGPDLVCGGNGNDTIKGGDGNDVLDGGRGDDGLNGGADDDRLLGNAGRDTLTGGTDADSFSGGSGTDQATDFNASEGDTKDSTIP
jgi:CSLREA domain-containing protein